MYNEWYEFLVNNLSNPLHGIIYLQTTPEMCLKRTQKRGRTGEDKISIDYLRQLHCLHEEWLGNEEKKKEMKVLRLNTNEEFEENETNKKELIFKTKCFINDIAFNKE